MEPDSRKIIHIDMDAFYASIEQRDFPDLIGKPVVVGGRPDSRSVVTTASYEARKFGIRSAMPCSMAYRLCPFALFVPPRFSVYREVSHQIQDIFCRYTDLVEPISLDEAYLDVTFPKVPVFSGIRIAKEIRQRIKAETGLTASAGVGTSKLIAKLASEANKPDGLTVILPEDSAMFLGALSVGQFPGVGSSTEQKLHRANIFTGEDIRRMGLAEMIGLLGKTGQWLWRAAQGLDNRPVEPNRPMRSVSAEETLETDTTDRCFMEEALGELARQVAHRLEKSGLSGRTVSLKIKFGDFEQITRSKTFTALVNDSTTLYESSVALLEAAELGARPVRLLGISVTNFGKHQGAEGKQLELQFSN